MAGIPTGGAQRRALAPCGGPVMLGREGGAVKLHLYSRKAPPSGRCLLLIAQLHRTTALSAEECIRLGERLFDSQFTEAAPAVVEVADAGSAELIRQCEEFGIKAEPVA